MRKTRFNTFFKLVYHIHFHAGSQKDETDI